jgi:hypothetical protein
MLLAQCGRGLLARLSRRRLKRGVFRSVVDLQATINRFLAETNADGLELTLSSSANGEQKLGGGTMELPFEGKVSGVRKKRQHQR